MCGMQDVCSSVIYLFNIPPRALEILRKKSEVCERMSELQVMKDGNPFSEGSNNDFGLIARFSI